MKKSIITGDMEHCVICGRDREQVHHCLFGSRRKLADEDGLIVPVCAECHRRIHDDSNMWRFFQKLAQSKYEERYGHESFMKRYGKNYL